MGFARIVIIVVALGALFGCEPKQEKKKPSAPSDTTAKDGGNKQGPASGQKEDVGEGDVDAHLAILRDLKGCDAKGEEFWCGVASAMTERSPGELPKASTVELGWTIFIPTQGKPEAANLVGEPIALGVNIVEGQEARAQVTHVIARNPENADKIKGLGKQVGDILMGKQPASEPVIVHDPQLLAYLRDQGARATNALKKEERGWAIADEKHTKLYRIGGGKLASVHRVRPRPDRPDGIWLSVYTPAELSGELAPKKELDLEGVTGKFDCSHNPAQVDLCKGFERFERAEKPVGMSGDVEELRVYFGKVYESDAQAESEKTYGALLVRQGKEGAEIAFSVVIPGSDEEREALAALQEGVEKGEIVKENAALAYLMGITRHPSAFGEATQSDGKSALVLRRGLFQGPDERTISYFRAEGDRYLALTHEHIGGKVWFWDLGPVKLPAK